MYLGDNLLAQGIKEFVETFRSEDLDALIFLKEVENPQAFGVAVLNKKGQVTKLVEKPKKPPSNLATCGKTQEAPVQPGLGGDLLLLTEHPRSH
jgi:glucose-1-phosphate thymidylyltransferase